VGRGGGVPGRGTHRHGRRSWEVAETEAAASWIGERRVRRWSGLMRGPAGLLAEQEDGSEPSRCSTRVRLPTGGPGVSDNDYEVNAMHMTSHIILLMAPTLMGSHW
jgi:hypothetical protein